MVKTGKYLVFKPKNKQGIRKVFDRNGDLIGCITWHVNLKKFLFKPETNTALFSEELEEIAKKLDYLQKHPFACPLT